MSRCIECRRYPTEWEYNAYHKGMIGKCSGCNKRVERISAIFPQVIECEDFDKRPQQEIEKIHEVLKMIGIDLEE